MFFGVLFSGKCSSLYIAIDDSCFFAWHSLTPFVLDKLVYSSPRVNWVASQCPCLRTGLRWIESGCGSFLLIIIAPFLILRSSIS
jgi:hypothetical protein